ncbi:MAG TPA: hypothetical protein VGH50_06705 [Candidatus Binatia bacterium]|jgi:hypothetical protein
MLVRRLGLVIVGAFGLALSGCAPLSSLGFQQRQHVSFIYGYANVRAGTRSAIVSQLQQGSMQITDTRIGAETGCAASTENIKFKLYGSWGDAGTNSSLQSNDFSMDQVTPSPPAPVCEMTPGNVPAALTILAGGGSPGIQVGEPVLDATFNIVIGKTMYTASNSYSKFVVDSFSPITNFTTGHFEFLGVNNRDPYDSRVLVVTGTFAIIKD